MFSPVLAVGHRCFRLIFATRLSHPSLWPYLGDLCYSSSLYYGESTLGREQLVMRVIDLESTSNMTGGYLESTRAASGCSAQEGVANTVYGLLGEGPGGVSK